MTEIKIPLPEMIDTSSLKFDQHNPNRMSAEQFGALKENIIRFGFHVPVVVDDGLVVSDGEHRVRAALELGIEKIPVVRLPVSEVERKILRQTLNKLRGRHDAVLDIEEYKRIFSTSADDYQRLMGLGEKEMSLLKELAEKGAVTLNGADFDHPKMDSHLEVYLRGNIKQITLYYAHEDFLRLIPLLQKAVAHSGKKDNTEFFSMLLERYVSENGLGA